MEQQVQAVLDWLAARRPSSGDDLDDATWLADFRAQTALIARLSGDPLPLHSVDHAVLGGVPVRFYRPAAGNLPVLFHIHGGGAIAGSLDGHDPMLRRLAARTGWTVAAPAYRLAPEARFPVQLDDAHAALVAIDAARIVVSGDSIGGTLATALARRVRDEGGPALAGQVLLYPNTDLRRTVGYPSRRSEDGRIIDAAGLERQIDLYLAHPGQREESTASPIISGDLAGLPPAFIITAEHDPLRDEGVAYAAALAAADVVVEHHRAADALHAFLQMDALQAGELALDRLADWLAKRVHGAIGST